MSIRGKLFFPAAVLLLFLISAGAIFASGQKEDPLSTAQQLINEKKYNDAILVLTDLMKNKPQEFDKAQALLEKVDKARQTYNQKVAELITVFNKGDLEKAYQIIKELEALDKAPNARTLESQAYARQTATFVYDTKQFQALMDKALPLLTAANYSEAVTTYLSGFSIGNDLFDQANYGNIIVDKVNGLRQDMKSAAENYVSAVGTLESQTKRIAQDIGQPAQIGSDLSGLVATLKQIQTFDAQVKNDMQQLKAERDAIVKQRSNEQDVPLISYLDRIVYGRSDAKQPEGILAAMNESWKASLSTVYAEISKHASDEMASAKKSYEAKQWDQATAQFAGAKSYALLAARAATAWGLQVDVGSSLSISSDSWSIIDQKLPNVLNNQLIAEAADGYTSLVAQSKAVTQIAETANTTTDSIQQLATQRQQVSQLSSSIREIQTTWKGRKQKYSAVSSQKIDLAAGLNEIDGVIAAANVAVSHADQTTVTIVAREGTLRMAPVSGQLADAKSTVARASQLINGIPPKDSSGIVAKDVKEKYPGQAETLLTKVQSELAGYRQSVNAATDYLSGESPSVVNAEPVQKMVAESKSLSSDISSLDSSISSLLSQAKQQLFEAERYRQQGQNTLQLAQNDLAQRNFASARQQIAAAADSFDKSLSYQENPQVRQIRDRQLPQLSSQITDAENAVVVRDVRNYINQGRDFYSQGDYARAQDMFLRAESRWKTTNTDPNPEITTWLQYVNTALSINSGRVVAPTDPLYPEITQVLNLAQSDYDKGKQLEANGQTAQANALLSQAQTKLLYVQIPFPLNKEARVLSLKILQLTDPQNFAATFKQKFDQAVGELKTNPQDAYIALKDLQVIEPNYQGLNQALYQAEILTGIKRPPPDPAKVTESNNLYQKAFDIVRQNVRAQFPIALSYLNKAIELDPNNQQAASLKDRISIDQGAATTVVLSSTDQVQFKLAQEQFIAKSYYEALRIVNQLLKDPANQNYSPLIELKRRIESKI